jgi:tRNA dimethylallyltransferase
MQRKPKIIVIAGPTATGKSDLAVQLALTLHGEIISADSRQVYKGLDIGTGKITTQEMCGIPHFMLDTSEPNKRFNVTDYTIQAKRIIEDIISRNKIPIIAGGTGFYIQSLIDGTIYSEVGPNQELRAELEEKNIEELCIQLNKIDPIRAGKIDKNNKRRLIRAIEIATAQGFVPSIKHNPLPYEVIFIGLEMNKDEIKTRIKDRLIKRLDQGMLDEVKNLHTNGLSYERMEELGLEYRYISRFLKGELSYDDMVTKLNTEIWHYAKRQLTWFKKDPRIKWIIKPFFENALNIIK